MVKFSFRILPEVSLMSSLEERQEKMKNGEGGKKSKEKEKRRFAELHQERY
jgi:hypothetical protein